MASTGTATESPYKISRWANVNGERAHMGDQSAVVPWVGLTCPVHGRNATSDAFAGGAAASED